MTNNKLDVFLRGTIEKRIKGNLYKQQKTNHDGINIIEDHVNNKLFGLFTDPENTCPGETLLQAIKFCCGHDLPLPGWVREEFLICYEVYNELNGDADSKTPLVSSFRTDPKRGNHRHQKRKKNQNMYLVWQEVNKLHKEGKPIDEHLFKVVGKKIGMSGSSIRDLYYDVKGLTKK